MSSQVSCAFPTSAFRAALLAVPQTRQIVGGGRQRQLYRYLLQASSRESSHPSLRFQYSEHRLDDRFSPTVHSLSPRLPPLASHAAMRRIARSRSQPSSAIQPARQIRIRNISVDFFLLQRFHRVDGEKSAVGAHPSG